MKRLGLVLTLLLVGGGLLVFAVFRPQPETWGFCGNGPQVGYEVAPEEGGYTLLNQVNTSGLILSNHIRALEVTPFGVLLGYAGSEVPLASAVSLVTDTVIETCQVDGVAPQGHVNDILLVNATIWVATDGMGVYRYSNHQWFNYTTANGLNDNRTYALLLAGGEINVATYEGVSKFNADTNSFFDLGANPNDRLPEHYHAALWLNDKAFLGTIGDGLYMVANGQEITYRNAEVVGWPGDLQVVPQLLSNNIRVLKVAPDGRIWVGGDPGLAALDLSNGQWENITPGPEPQDCGVMDIEFTGVGMEAYITGTCGTRHLVPTSNGLGTRTDVYWAGGLSLELGVEGPFAEKVLIGSDGSGLYIGPLVP